MSQKLLIIVILTVLLMAACSRGKTNQLIHLRQQSQIKGLIRSEPGAGLGRAIPERTSKCIISVTGGGSGTGITALSSGTTDIANASREMKEEEIDTATKNGFTPQEFVIARDAIAVIVNPEEPGQGTYPGADFEYLSCEINNWSEVGGEDRPIVRLSRETNSGTHVISWKPLSVWAAKKINHFLPGNIAAAFFRRDHCRGAG